MSATANKLWLLAYDIACPRRLRRVHRRVKCAGLRLQYSMYATRARDGGIASLLEEIDALIDNGEDDVRAYHVPASCKVWTMGRDALPEGVSFDAEEVVRMLRRTVADEAIDDASGDADGVDLIA